MAAVAKLFVIEAMRDIESLSIGNAGFRVRLPREPAWITLPR
jgi:hypothetical protein